MPDDNGLPTYADVLDAARRLAPHAISTPLLESPALNARIGGRLFIKAEMLQRTGAFKFRGAYNRISRITEGDRAKGVVTFSSGNHGQAVAAVAKLLGLAARIVMPADAPAIKIDSTRAHGAEVVLYDRAKESREAVAAEIARRTGATMVPPFDDPFVAAGQGTAGLEIALDAKRRGIELHAALVPVSGGGLIAGCALALTRHFPDIAVYAVEPVGFDDTGRSLRSGRREKIDSAARTICDALQVAQPGEVTFPVNSRLLAGGVAVDDETTKAAMAAAFQHLKVIAEPSGAIALAAALGGSIDIRDRNVAVVCSGGNVDAAAFAAAIRPA
jgi:threonine dehydratase